MNEIYWDHNSTTILDPAAAREIEVALRRGYANPSSQHRPGRAARHALAAAREQIAEYLGAVQGPGGDRLIFTSGGTEANNLAIMGLCGVPPASIVVSAIEHPSVSRTVEKLRGQGFGIRTLPVDSDGVARIDALEGLIDKDTRLVCLMLANNETGVIQPVSQASEICRRRGVPLHTDAVQAVGKMDVQFRSLGASTLSLGAHKFNGPRGIGALLARADAPLSALFAGGSQQGGLRPGTEDVALALGMAAALSRWHELGSLRRGEMLELRNRLEGQLLARIPDATVIGANAARLPQTTQIAFPGVNRQTLFMAADLQGVYLSTGSACASGSSEPSPTLRGMELPAALVDSSVRISLGFQTTREEIDRGVEVIAEIVRNSRQKTPLSASSRPSRMA